MLAAVLASLHDRTGAPDIFVLVEQVQPSGKDGKFYCTIFPILAH